MQITLFSFIMSLLWFNLYIVIINIFRKNDRFIISFSGLPLLFFLFLSILRLLFNFEIPGAIIIRSKIIFTTVYDFIKMPISLKYFNIEVFHLLISIWIMAIIVLLFNNIKKYINFKKSLSKLDKQQGKGTEQILNRILSLKNMNNKLDIIQNENISSPFIIGILKGQIYIPRINFSEGELEYIISHEINHFIEKDSLKKILIQSIKCLFWWNPLSHLFANNFNHILEIQCDLKTTANFSEDKKIEYLESITKIVRTDINDNTKNTKNVKYSNVPNFAEIDQIESLKQRFRIVLNYKSKINIFKIANISLYVLASFLFISSYFIIIQPHYDPPNHENYTIEDQDISFILEKSTGSYDIYIDNIFKYNIKNLEDLNENLRDLPIYKEKLD